MGTTRIKVIDLSSDRKEIKTARKHAEKIAWKKDEKETKAKPATTESPEDKEISENEKPRTSETVESPDSKSVPTVVASKPKRPVSSAVAKKSLRHQGTKYLNAVSKIEKGKLYNAQEAVDLLYETSYVKFDPTVELHLQVVDKSVRGSVALPHMVGKKKEKTFLVFSEKKEDIPGKKIIWAEEKSIGQIESGSIKPKRDFDQVIATPKFMPELAKVAKILGPAGMMPNPKNNTVTENIKEALSSEKDDLHEFRTEPNAPIVHTTLGKLSQKKEEISENAKVLITTIGPSKIKNATLTSTMGPAIKFDPASFVPK